MSGWQHDCAKTSFNWEPLTGCWLCMHRSHSSHLALDILTNVTANLTQRGGCHCQSLLKKSQVLTGCHHSTDHSAALALDCDCALMLTKSCFWVSFVLVGGYQSFNHSNLVVSFHISFFCLSEHTAFIKTFSLSLPSIDCPAYQKNILSELSFVTDVFPCSQVSVAHFFHLFLPVASGNEHKATDQTVMSWNHWQQCLW